MNLKKRKYNDFKIVNKNQIWSNNNLIHFAMNILIRKRMLKKKYIFADFQAGNGNFLKYVINDLNVSNKQLLFSEIQPRLYLNLKKNYGYQHLNYKNFYNNCFKFKLQEDKRPDIIWSNPPFDDYLKYFKFNLQILKLNGLIICIAPGNYLMKKQSIKNSKAYKYKIFIKFLIKKQKIKLIYETNFKNPWENRTQFDCTIQIWKKIKPIKFLNLQKK